MEVLYRDVSAYLRNEVLMTETWPTEVHYRTSVNKLSLGCFLLPLVTEREVMALNVQLDGENFGNIKHVCCSLSSILQKYLNRSHNFNGDSIDYSNLLICSE